MTESINTTSNAIGLTIIAGELLRRLTPKSEDSYKLDQLTASIAQTKSSIDKILDTVSDSINNLTDNEKKQLQPNVDAALKDAVRCFEERVLGFSTIE